MKKVMILFFTTFFIHLSVSIPVMVQEVLAKEGMPSSFSSVGSMPSFSVSSIHIDKDPSIIFAWPAIRYRSATSGHVANHYDFHVSLAAHKDVVFTNRIGGFDSFDDMQDLSGNRSVFLSGDMSPIPHYGFTLSAYYCPKSEYFDNRMAGMAFQYKTGKTTFNARYVEAIHQEEDKALDDAEYYEYAWFGAVGYQITNPLQLAIRYEAFNDDRPNRQEESIDERISIGGKIRLYSKGLFNTNLMAEYRKITFEKKTDDSLNTRAEFLTRLAIEF